MLPLLLLATACNVDPGTTNLSNTETATGNTDDTSMTDETTDTGDGDGDTGDGDGDTTTTTETGDGDGDGDGDTGPSMCGDSIISGFETCDCGDDGECTAEELDNLDCTGVMDPASGNFFDGGVLTCNMSCQFDTSNCFVCGDGFLTMSEACDGEQFGENTCGTAGFLGGDIACTDTCELDTSGCTEATWFDGFDTGEIDVMVWGFAGNEGWIVDDSVFQAGTHSARAGNIGPNGTSNLILDMTWAADGTIAFAHRHDSEGTLDSMRFYIDDVQQGETWGGTDAVWLDDAFPVTAGTHRLEWRYSKDGSVDTGADTAWLDNVRSDGVPAVATCGDNFLSTSEVCDGADVGIATCQGEGFLGGAIACDGNCELDTSGCTMATWTEDWETGSIDNATWGSGGDAAWVIDNVEANNGSFSAHSGVIGANQSSNLVLDMDWAAAGTIAFSYKTDSESIDELRFFIDDVEQGTGWGGGNTPWQQVSFPVTAGTHRVEWRYQKDGSVDTGLDRVWIDDIQSDGTVTVPVCGDNWLSSSEICDGTEVGGNTCIGEGFLGGVMGCDGSCQLDTSGCVNANFTEDFEDLMWDTPPFSDGGVSAWSLDTIEGQGSTRSARSGVVADNEATDLNLTLDWATPGVINFAHKQNSQAGDQLIFLIDDVEQGSWEGVANWADESFLVTTAGQHTLTWRYQKDASGSTVSDRVWIDNIATDGTVP